MHVKAGEVLFEQQWGDLMICTCVEASSVCANWPTAVRVVKTAAPGDHFGEIGVLFHLPFGSSTGSRLTAVGYTAQAFRERLGVTRVADLIEHRELASSSSASRVPEGLRGRGAAWSTAPTEPPWNTR